MEQVADPVVALPTHAPVPGTDLQERMDSPVGGMGHLLVVDIDPAVDTALVDGTRLVVERDLLEVVVEKDYWDCY